MPVLITGASGRIGRALAGRLLDEGAQVRAFLRRDDPALRAEGVHIAIGGFDDVPRLESALTQVHTLVHLAGGWWPAPGVSYDDLIRDPAETAAIAARAAGVRRIVTLSIPGADPGSTNELLAAAGRAEDHLATAGAELVVIRCAPVVESLPALFARLARGPMLVVPGDGKQPLNPVALADVLDALVAADSREERLAGAWDLGGPESVPMDALARRFGPAKRITHLRAASPAPGALVEVLGAGIEVDPARAVQTFGLRLRAPSNAPTSGPRTPS